MTTKDKYDTKICIKCKIQKDISEFYSYYRTSTNKQYIKSTCKQCLSEYNSAMYRNNGSLRKNISDYHQKNKDRRNKLSQENYYKNHEYYKRKRIENRIITREYLRVYCNKKRNDDPLFRLKHNLRTLLWYYFNKMKYKKKGSTKAIIGADYDTVSQYIERQFTKGMTWDNYGEWQVDHILPLSLAKTDEELIELFHYSNLQPMWKSENISKRDKIVEHQRKLAI